MKRLGDRGTDALTVAHKLVGLAWVVSAVAVLVLVVPALGSSAAAWGRVSAFQRAGGVASVVTLLFGLVYGLWTVWGFLRNRWVAAKWALYLVAVSTAGYAMPAARARDASLVVALTATQLAAMAAAMGVGVYLERSRHAGTLP